MVKDLAQVINYGSPAALYPAGAIALLTIGRELHRRLAACRLLQGPREGA